MNMANVNTERYLQFDASWILKIRVVLNCVALVASGEKLL